MKSNIRKLLVPFLLLITVSLYSKNIEGIYQNEELGRVVVEKFGKENKGYFVEFKNKKYFFKLEESVYVHFYHKNKEAYEKWTLEKQKRNLSLTQSSKTYKLKKKEKLKSINNAESFSGTQKQMFNLNTKNYCAGEFYDLSPKGFMPFDYDRGFIKEHNLSNLHVEWKDGTHTSDETTPRYDFYYTFDSFGNTEKMKANTYYHGKKSKNEIEWNYYYENKEEGILDSVVMHTRIWSVNGFIDNSTTIYVDNDKWVCDEKNQKIGRINNFNWTFNKESLPVKWKGNKGKREGFSMDFIYTEKVLTKMVLRNEKHKTEKVNEFTFEYSSAGILTSVTRISN